MMYRLCAEIWTNRGLVKLWVLFQIPSKFSLLVRVINFIHIHLQACYLLINYSIQLLVYCLSPICNWWYQGELGFCCIQAEPCINVYGRIWLYMEVLGEPCASFREIKAITSKLTVFTLYYFIILFLGIFGKKLGWGRHLQSGPDWSRRV